MAIPRLAEKEIQLDARIYTTTIKKTPNGMMDYEDQGKVFPFDTLKMQHCVCSTGVCK